MLTNSSTVRFANYLWCEYRRLSVLGIFCILVGALVDASSAILIAPIFDLIMQDQGGGTSYTGITEKTFYYFELIGLPKTATAALFLFLVVYVLRSLISILVGWLDAIIRALFTKNMTVNIFAAVVNANWRFFLKKNQGEFINSITRETVLLNVALASFSTCIVAIFQIAAFSFIALWVSWKLTLICLAIAFFSAIPLILLSRFNYRWGQESVECAGESNSITQESFALSKVIQAFAKQDYSLNRLQEQQEIQYKLNVKSYTLIRVLHEFYYPLGLISVISGYYFSRRFDLPFAELTIILYALWKCVPHISSFLRSYGVLGQHLPSFENIRKLELDALANQIPQGGKDFLGLKSEIQFKNLSFQYENTERNAIENISFAIKKGQMVAFVGASGAGKSTLADIIMGFHELQSGQMVIDGQNFEELNLRSFREKIGYIPQQCVLFNSTIRENLKWAFEDASEEEMITACKQANAYEFIQELAQGLDAMVGDRGIRLSGGQVQRLAIARAILRKPGILILDEATSALDSESEAAIQHAIDNISHSTTLVVIAHRLSTIRNADVIFVMEEGRIIEEGNHQKLMSLEDGRFRQLWNKQIDS